MIKNKDAQSAIELLILISAVFFFFVVFLSVIQTSIADKNRERANLEVSEIANIVRDEISLASTSSDGYFRSFALPPRVANRDYQASVEDDVVYVSTNDGRYALVLSVLNVTGQAVIGTNNIRKIDGRVYLNTDPS